MYSMKNIDGKKSNTATAVNIVTEYYEFKDTLFSWKVVRHKIRRIQSKKKKTENWYILSQQNIIIMIWW